MNKSDNDILDSVAEEVTGSGPPREPFEVLLGDVDDSQEELAELIARRRREYARKKRAEEARKLIQVNVNIDGPIGILHFGDPHVDDDGTDIAALEEHTEIVRNTEGLFAANVGDSRNNWIGRLARLWAQQSTSADDALRLCEWLLRSCHWLYILGGNHDCWSGVDDPIRFIARDTNSLYQSTEARLELNFPNGRKVRVNARHDFAGHSQWNSAHGVMKAAQFGTHDHILVAGHKHVSGYGAVKCPATGVISHCVRVASFKVYDRFARERGFRDQHISPSATTIIDPECADDSPSLVQLFWEPGPAAEYLTWLRARRSSVEVP